MRRTTDWFRCETSLLWFGHWSRRPNKLMRPCFLLRWADETFVTAYCGVCVCVSVRQTATIDVWTAIEHWLHWRDVGRILIKYKRTKQKKEERDVASENGVLYGSASITICMIRFVIAMMMIVGSSGDLLLSTNHYNQNKRETNLHVNYSGTPVYHIGWTTLNICFLSYCVRCHWNVYLHRSIIVFKSLFRFEASSFDISVLFFFFGSSLLFCSSLLLPLNPLVWKLWMCRLAQFGMYFDLV